MKFNPVTYAMTLLRYILYKSQYVGFVSLNTATVIVVVFAVTMYVLVLFVMNKKK